MRRWLILGAGMTLLAGCGGGSSGGMSVGMGMVGSGPARMSLRVAAPAVRDAISNNALFFRVTVSPGGVVADHISRQQITSSTGIEFVVPVGLLTVQVDDFSDAAETQPVDSGSAQVTVVASTLNTVAVTLSPLPLAQFVFSSDNASGRIQASEVSNPSTGALAASSVAAQVPGIEQIAVSQDGRFLFATVEGPSESGGGVQAFSIGAHGTLTPLGGIVGVNPNDATASPLGPIAVSADDGCVIITTSNIEASAINPQHGLQSYRFDGQTLTPAGGHINGVPNAGGSSVNGTPLSVGTAVAPASAGGTVRVAILGADSVSQGDVESFTLDANAVLSDLVSDLFAGVGVTNISNAFNVVPPQATFTQAITFVDRLANTNCSSFDVTTDGPLVIADATNLTVGSGIDLPVSVAYVTPASGTPYLITTSDGNSTDVFAFAIDIARGGPAVDHEAPLATQTTGGQIQSAGLLPPLVTGSDSLFYAALKASTNNVLSSPLTGALPFIGSPTTSTITAQNPFIPVFPAGATVLK